jgi:hypothetical protein
MITDDRVFACHDLMAWLKLTDWHYALRLKCDVLVHGVNRHPIEVGKLYPPVHQAVGGRLMAWTENTPLPSVDGADPIDGNYAPFTVAGSNFFGTEFYSRPTVYLVGCGGGGNGGNGGGSGGNQPCDCVNGGCVPKTTYGTPGKYASLAACQSSCAKDSNCTGECVSSEEIAALQQAANKAQANCCK